jgi:hypothetical protein
MAKMTMRTPEDFGFLPVVYSHGWYQCPPFYWDAERKTLTRVASDASGQPMILRIREPRRGALEIQADVAGKLSEAEEPGAFCAALRCGRSSSSRSAAPTSSGRRRSG